jgi:hypothetical protein
MFLVFRDHSRRCGGVRDGKEERAGWAFFFLATGVGVVVALVAAPELPHWSIWSLIALGGLCFSIAAHNFGWFKTPFRVGSLPRAMCILALIWGPMAWLGFKVWPEEGYCYLDFSGQAINWHAGVLVVNMTSQPVDNVKMEISEVLYKSETDQSGTMLWGTSLNIGTCRARLIEGLEMRVPVADEQHLTYDIFIISRNQMFREIIKLTRESSNRYGENLQVFRGAEQTPFLSRTGALSLVVDPRLP